MPLISLHGQTYTYVLIKEPRKSVRLKMLTADSIEVKTPRRFSLQKTERILRQNEHWIQQHHKQFLQKDAVQVNRDLASGSAVLWRGTPVILAITKSAEKQTRCTLTNGFLQIEHSHFGEAFQNDLKKWYINQSKKYLTDRTAYWQEKINVTIGKIQIKDQKTRWGSCSSLGNINFNWRMIMAPPETMDYLIIHELCHRIHLNHSPEFWAMVSAYCPGYKQQQSWLKTNGYLLFRIL